MKYLLAALGFFLMTATAHGQQIVAQIDYADQGRVYAKNHTSASVRVEMSFLNTAGAGGACGFDLEPGQTNYCTPPSWFEWASVTGSVETWILFGGNMLHGVPLQTSGFYNAGPTAAFAVVNPNDATIVVVLTLYNEVFTAVDQVQMQIPRYGDFAQFASEVFPNVDLGSGTYYLDIASSSQTGVLAVVCDSGVCWEV